MLKLISSRFRRRRWLREDVGDLLHLGGGETACPPQRYAKCNGDRRNSNNEADPPGVFSQELSRLGGRTLDRLKEVRQKRFDVSPPSTLRMPNPEVGDARR